MSPVRPFVSVVIPVWNEVTHIDGVIRTASAALEHWGNGELIVVDNGSGDGTWELLQHLRESRPMVLLQNASASIGELRNIGARAAKGDLLMFLDGDCLVDPEHLERAWSVLERTGAAATGSPAAPPPDPHWSEDVWFRLHDLDQDGPVRYLGAANLMIRRQAFESVGGFDSTLATGEDAELALRLRQKGLVIHRAREVRAFHLGNPKTIPDFCRRQWWHGLGIVRPFEVLDRPLVMSLSHLILSMAGLVAVLRSPGPATGAFFLGATLIVPVITVVARLRRSRRLVPLAPAIALYWLYFACRLAALSTLLFGWPRLPRGWKTPARPIAA